MRLSRRSLLSAAPGALLLPRLARADAPAQRRFLFVLAEGGWDQTFLFAPLFGEPLIDIVGDTAFLRGINTITQDGSVVDCQRFTDVFIRAGSEWKALAAQETRLAPEACAAPAP